MKRTTTWPREDQWVHRPDVWAALVGAGHGVVESFRPTALPRSTLSQALMAGVNGAIQFGVAGGTHRALAPALRHPAGPVIAGAVGAAALVQRWVPPPSPTEPVALATARTSLALAGTGAMASAVVHAVAQSERPWRAGLVATGTLGAVGGGLIAWRSRRIERTDLAFGTRLRPLRALRTATGVAAGLGLLVNGIRSSGGVFATTLQRRLGLPPGAARWVGNGIATLAWSGAGVLAFDTTRSMLARFDRMLDPGYDRPPVTPARTGGPGSPLPWARVGREGRRFITTAVPASRISAVMGRPAVAEPIRVYAGYDMARDPEDRVTLALAELARTGAYDRSVIVVVQPPGSGLVNTVAVQAAEFATRGDVATVVVQYARVPSVLALQKNTEAARLQRHLLEGMQRAIARRPLEQRPRVVVYGESQGAWAGQDTFLHGGVATMDELGVSRALWVGTPAYSGWRNEIRSGQVPVPPGSVVEVQTAAELVAELGGDGRALRVVLLNRADDPVVHLHHTVLVRRPDWLTPPKPSGIPRSMHWAPVSSGVQLIFDGLNAMQGGPGALISLGHTYTADLPLAVPIAWDLPRFDAETLHRVSQAITAAELEHAQTLHHAPTVEAVHAVVAAESVPTA